MRKEVEVCIVQTPILVSYKCPHCEEDVNIDYEEFGHTLTEMLYDNIDINCLLCQGKLKVDYAYLD